MTTRKTRRIRKTKKVRKGSGVVSQFMRDNVGVSINDSTKQAALDIKNIYANYSATQLDFGKHKPDINKIFERTFGYSPFGTPKQRILMELNKFKKDGGPDVSPKNLYRAIIDIADRPEK